MAKPVNSAVRNASATPSGSAKSALGKKSTRAAKRAKTKTMSTATTTTTKANHGKKMSPLVADALFDHDLYKVCSNPPVPGELFGVRDLSSRLALSIGLIYYLMLTRPISYFKYTLYYNMAWYYNIPGAIMTFHFLPCDAFFLACCRHRADDQG